MIWTANPPRRAATNYRWGGNGPFHGLPGFEF